MWPQAGLDEEDVSGVAVGWHFQSEPPKRPLGWFLSKWGLPKHYSETATKNWELDNCKSLGIVDERWRLEATGPSPTLTTPEDMGFDAFNAPYMQLRWKRDGKAPNHALPYMEWLREGDTEFGPDRRLYIHSYESDYSHYTKSQHAMLVTHRHPKWKGKIKRVRLSLAPGESDVTLDVHSFFTAYDTRHPINNPIFVSTSWNYFRWTGDIGFLRENVNRMRTAMRYQMTEMGGLENNHILNQWPGHDGLVGWVNTPDGGKDILPGHGIGNNYYDLVPFGWKDCYSTAQYYRTLLVMADVEEAIRDNPGWGVPGGALKLDPDELRKHAAAVKDVGNRLFWNEKTGRFYGWYDRNGKPHDYGFTFVALEAIWYDFATDEHARALLDWISGKRIVAGDTSTGKDIYKWRFGPRATTLRNLECYGQGWWEPEIIEWGDQIQDGGAVVGFAFYDVHARIKLLGADDGWQRLTEFLAWEEDVWEFGGYRAYYEKNDGTLQGGGTPGGIGVDKEFFESSFPPSIVIYGFLGIDPVADAIKISPKLPAACPEMTVRNLLYRSIPMDITATESAIAITLQRAPLDGLKIRLDGQWVYEETGKSGDSFTLRRDGDHRLRKAR